jgi:hypothetical protein
MAIRWRVVRGLDGSMTILLQRAAGADQLFVCTATVTKMA